MDEMQDIKSLLKNSGDRLEVVAALRRQRPDLEDMIQLCNYIWCRLEMVERQLADLAETVDYLAPSD